MRHLIDSLKSLGLAGIGAGIDSVGVGNYSGFAAVGFGWVGSDHHTQP